MKERPILWLKGVRRTGKTTLAGMVPDVSYFDCELPSVRRKLEDPESFLASHGSGTIVLDEIHLLENPSQILKIAADLFPKLRIVATGSSSLSASAKFRDTLTGRKTELLLTPMISADLDDFRQKDLERRLLHGGLPPFFLAETPKEKDFQEWLDSYWSKDIQELFHIERRGSFLKFTELLLQQSGRMFEASSFAAPCEVSRPTISNYLEVLKETFVAYPVRPFHSRKSSEITAAAKVYAFDTGFICCFRGWTQLRPEDFGTLWEHLVLNELIARLPTAEILYWREIRGYEVDFIVRKPGKPPLAVECKWKSKQFDPKRLTKFRSRYLQGKNVVVASDVNERYPRRYGALEVLFVPLRDSLEDLL